MKNISKNQKIRINSLILLHFKNYLFFVPFLFLGCNDDNKKIMEDAHNEIDSTLEILEKDREIIERQKEKIEELEESWRIRDSVDGFSTNLQDSN